MTSKRSEPLLSVCRVERGIYVFRYAEANDRPYPKADVTVMNGEISLVPAPGREGAALTAPGQVMVIVAEEAGEFEVRVIPVDGGTTNARFNLDLLDAGEDRRQVRVEIEDRNRRFDRHGIGSRPLDAEKAGRAVSVAAHVSRLGDVVVGAQQWVAGPNDILPVEGLSIATGQRDVGVRIRVQSMRGDRQWSRWHEPEHFAGSRQQADPLTSVALALTGTAAAQFEIVADVMALGSPLETKTGQSVEFFGVDPIVGFRFGLNPVTRHDESAVERPTSPLRVFRAKK